MLTSSPPRRASPTSTSLRIPHLLLLLVVLLLITSPSAAADCDCGYRIKQTGQLFTHQSAVTFNTSANSSTALGSEWEVQGWRVPANTTLGTVPRQNRAANVWVADSKLHLRQRAWREGEDVSIAEIHTGRDDILYGSFRIRSTVVQPQAATGGAVAGFFFYRDDVTETDIEIITKDGNSSKTVHYINHPTYNVETDTLIPGTSFTEPLDKPWTEMQWHRFDWGRNSTSFYQDNVFKRQISKNVPDEPGKIMINIWANNGSWSGPPSSRDVTLQIEQIRLYFNTTTSNAGQDEQFNAQCAQAKNDDKAVCDVEDENEPAGTGENGSSSGRLSAGGWWMALVAVVVVVSAAWV